MAAQPVGKAGILEVLDPELGLAAAHIPVVEGQGVQVRAAGHDETEVAAFLQLLGLIDDASRVRPRVGGVLPFTEEAYLRTGRRVLLFGLLYPGRRERRQPRVRREADGVVDALALAVVVEGRDRKAAIGAQLHADAGPAGAEDADQTLKDGDHAATGMRRPSAQDGGNELVGVAVGDEEGVGHVLAGGALGGGALLRPLSGGVRAIPGRRHIGGGGRGQWGRGPASTGRGGPAPSGSRRGGRRHSPGAKAWAGWPNRRSACGGDDHTRA